MTLATDDLAVVPVANSAAGGADMLYKALCGFASNAVNLTKIAS